MATTMPAGRPPRPAGACTVIAASHRVAPFRPGQLVRTVSGATFRVAKDGARVHYATGCRRNVVHIDGLPAGMPLPSPLLRALITWFAQGPVDGPRRAWRLRLVEAQWYLSLEVRAAAQRLTFPEGSGSSTDTPGVPVDPQDLEGVGQVCAHLWARADDHESDTRRPADLDHLRQVYGHQLRA